MEHAKTGSVSSFLVRKTMAGQMELWDFLNPDGEEEYGEFGVSFGSTFCLSRGFLLGCTFALYLIP